MLSPTIHGVGQFWDWVFPYYTDQIGNFFSRASEAWTSTAMGSPLSYTSDYFFRFIVSLFGWVRPEFLLYGVLLCIFVAGAWGVYAIAGRHTKPWIACLLGMAAFVNPTTFYKFTAGHVDYFISYALFIYLIYFLLYCFKPTTRNGIVVGLLLALIGVQIQFFVIAGLFIGLFFIFKPSEWRFRYLVPVLGLPLLINLVWLSNFLFGGANLADVSGQAAKVSFKASSSTQYLSIFDFSFSNATLISRFYSFYELLLCGVFFLAVVVLLIRAKHKQMEDAFLLVFMLIMLFLATGLFQVINLGPLTTFYPMFREVGHFAPVLVLVMIVLLGRLLPRGAMKWLICGWLVAIICISFSKYQTNPQAINFATVRSQFAEFKQFGDQHPDADHRVLAYPFWDQYAFTASSQSFQEGLPLRNSGHDSFAAFSNDQFIKNAVAPQDFKNSVQYRLEQTLDIAVLRPYNVRYIYDFSNIYESYYDRYVAPATYNNDLSLIKNNPDFLTELLQANPGQLKRISSHILEIMNYGPRVGTTNNVYAVDSADSGERARSFVQDISPNQPYDYVVNQGQPLPSSASVAPLFADASSSNLLNPKNQSLDQTLQLPTGASHATLYSSSAPSEVTYRVSKGSITFYATNTGKLYANHQLIADGDTATPVEVGHMNAEKGQQYYASLNDVIIPLAQDGSGTIGHVDSGGKIVLYSSVGKNLIDNPSFESGLWSNDVSDCHNYDQNPEIAMDLNITTATDGHNSLELLASRHDACTSSTVNLTGGATYLLKYDYQSPNAQIASFYLRFNASDQGSIHRYQGISDQDWHTTRQLITAPSNATTGQLFVHAVGSNAADPAVNRYDNFDFVQLQKLGEVIVSPSTSAYTAHPLATNGATLFQFVDAAFTYQNLIRNGSFEQGPWQSKVTDCNNHDQSPLIAAGIDRTNKTDGNQSLVLEATRHVACEYTDATVQPGMDYILSFDYQSPNAQQAGYYMEFTGADTGQQERIPINDQKWHRYTVKLSIPAPTTNVRLYLHAYDSDGMTNNIVRFDNVKLIAVPSIDSQFYVVSSPPTQLKEPSHITFHTDSNTRRTVHISGASAPFILNLSETYHPMWRLELSNQRLSGGSGWLPGTTVDTIGIHFELDNYMNAWYIDPATVCAKNIQGCTKHPDGSYDIDAVIEFVPERWFAISRIVSVATLLTTSAYLLITSCRREKEAIEGYYRHPLLDRSQDRRKR